MQADIRNDVSISVGSFKFPDSMRVRGALCDVHTLSKKVTGVPKGQIARSGRRKHIKKGRKPQQGMGSNRDRLKSFILQPVAGSVCATNMQYLCQILLGQNQETHVSVPSKASELSTAVKEVVGKVPLPSETLVTNLTVRTVLQGHFRQKKGKEGMGRDGATDVLNVKKLRHL